MTNLKRGLATLTLVALSLPGLRAFAQAPDGSEQPEEKAKPEAPAEPAAPAEPVEAPKPPPPAASGSPSYIGFAPPPPPARFENSVASLTVGILLQPQFEMAGAPDAEKTTKNLFLRRTRLIVGGTLFKSIEFFFQTDWPNLFKLDPADTMAFDKNGGGMNVQDAFATAKPLASLGDSVTRMFDLKIDAGFMLPPLSHNSLESAAKLFGPDYFINSFRRNITNNADPFRAAGPAPVGRDAGVQLRILAVNGHIELRAGAFMGKRAGAVPQSAGVQATVGGLNAFRYAGRVQLNLLDPEPGFFYAGSYLGARKIVSVGGFFDIQDQYKYFGADFLVDLPLGPGVFTAQGDFGRWDGGTWIPLPKESVYMAEVGYTIGPIMLSPIARFERLVGPKIMDPANPTGPLIGDNANPSEDRFGGGFAFWPYGYNSNIKVFFTQIKRDPAPHSFYAINVQWQVYYF